MPRTHIHESGLRWFAIQAVELSVLSVLSVLPTLAQDLPTQNPDPHKMFIKFNQGSGLLKLAREQSAFQNQQQDSALNSFQAALGIKSLRPLKPDATLDRLPGGVERLFVASLADSAELTRALGSAHSLNQLEYVEPVLKGDGTGEGLAAKSQPQQVMETSFFPNDPKFPSQWALHNTGQNGGSYLGKAGADLGMLSAWGITTGSSDVVVAFLSSGIQADTYEFFGRVMRSGYNFVSDNNDVTDENGLGTDVASIAAAAGNNSLAIAGVDWKCLILPVKVMGSSVFNYSVDWLANGIIYAADKGANVICIGLGNKADGSAVLDAVTYAVSKGVIIVCGVPSGWGYYNSYSAAYDNIILVGSLDERDMRYSSCYGRVDFMAPGRNILGLYFSNPSYTTSLGGPIAASALASGVVSLMLSIDKSLTFKEVYDILKESAVDQIGPPNEDTPGWDQYYGWGRIDAYRALRILKERSQEIPERFTASQNYPNPFNPATTIEYDLPKTNGSRQSQVLLKIYNVLGQPVATLVDELQAPGYHHAQWTTDSPSGVYFYRLQVDDRVVVRKMILAK